MRVAIVHDWLLGMRGGERCLECILEFFPEADIYTLFYDPSGVSAAIRSRPVYPSVLNRLPFVKRYYRHLLPFYSLGLRSLETNISEGKYDLLVSISHCVAKNIRVPSGTYHLCYCLTPARYLWDQYDSYFKGKLLEPLLRPILKRLKAEDAKRAEGVNRYAAISEFVAERIRSYYGRDSAIVYPPVRTDWIKPREEDEAGEGFLCVNALVPYKNVDLVIAAFNELALPLLVVGSGPLDAELRAMAGPTISFRSGLSEEELARVYREAKALVFAGEEDFGMIPVENLAAGRPVICYGRGGVLETMSRSAAAPTAVFFSDLNTAGVCLAVRDFILRQEQFTVDNCVSQARKFSLERFQQDFGALLESSGFPVRPPQMASLERRQARAR